MNKLYNKVLLGDNNIVIKEIPDNYIQSIITSPPYYKKRLYSNKEELGDELDYNDYINNFIILTKELKRVLKEDGIFFLNIDDTYNSFNNNIPKSSLMMIPERISIRLIEDGWVLRNKIIWRKLNPLPQSVKNRFSNSFEYLYMFTKNNNYKFNRILTPIKESSLKRIKCIKNKGKEFYNKSISFNNDVMGERYAPKDGANLKDYWVNIEDNEFLLDLLDSNNNIFSLSKTNSRINHPAIMPESLVDRCITCSTDEGDIILDPYIGSGTVAIQSLLKKRCFIGIEMDENYYNDCINNILNKTGVYGK